MPEWRKPQTKDMRPTRRGEGECAISSAFPLRLCLDRCDALQRPRLIGSVVAVSSMPGRRALTGEAWVRGAIAARPTCGGETRRKRGVAAIGVVAIVQTV